MPEQPGAHLKLNNSELWGGLIGLVLGIFVIRSGIKLKLGSINDPGSGYVLFYTGILMCLFALTIMFSAISEGGANFASRWEGARWTRPLIVIACLIAFSLAMSLLLPITLSGTPESGIIMMAGIYYGSMYGGSTTSILVNIPGEAASVVTCIDGHQMAKQGRAGPALGISALGSFIAGTFSLVALMLVAPSLASVAIAFGPAEYFSLMVLGLVVLTFLTQGSMAKALLMACIGIVLGLIGLDSITAQPRLTFGRMELIDGIGLVPVVMGLFGVAEVLLNTEQVIKRDIINARITQLLPNKADWQASAGPIGRGTLLGFFLGILPGGGAVVASFASYALEKRLSKTPERFGHGAIEGVAGPESANNAAAGGAFIPPMTLGIPPNVVMALLLGAFVIHGLQHGPLLITQTPWLFWGIVAST